MIIRTSSSPFTELWVIWKRTSLDFTFHSCTKRTKIRRLFFFFLAKKKKSPDRRLPRRRPLGFVCHKRQTNPKGRLRGGYSCIAFHRPFCWLFLCLFSLQLGLFFASLCHKFNLSRDDCILLLNLNCHMAPVYNFQAEA